MSFPHSEQNLSTRDNLPSNGYSFLPNFPFDILSSLEAHYCPNTFHQFNWLFNVRLLFNRTRAFISRIRDGKEGSCFDIRRIVGGWLDEPLIVGDRPTLVSLLSLSRKEEEDECARFLPPPPLSDLDITISRLHTCASSGDHRSDRAGPIVLRGSPSLPVRSARFLA